MLQCNHHEPMLIVSSIMTTTTTQQQKFQQLQKHLPKLQVFGMCLKKIGTISANISTVGQKIRKESRPKKTREIKYICKSISGILFYQNPFFAISKNGQESIFELGKV